MIKPIQKRISYTDLRQIADSGQCFRMTEKDGLFSVISKEHYLEVEEVTGSIDFSQERIFNFYCEKESLSFWEHYFDLEHDYGSYIGSVRKKDSYLSCAADAGGGIRILNQDPWEMIITFVISQQKTIPKIREAVEALSQQYGTKHEITSAKDGKNIVWYSFPRPEQLSKASEETLRQMKLGYRAKYIFRLCQDAVSGNLNLDALKQMGYEEAMAYLKGFYGIGTKVANCICLFGLHHIEAFPVDTWIEQILMEQYYRKRKKKYDALPKSRLYDEMIQDHFGMYKGYAGVMQQYIFYYERAQREKIK